MVLPHYWRYPNWSEHFPPKFPQLTQYPQHFSEKSMEIELLRLALDLLEVV
jgi:hypothetical protein